MDWRSFWKKRQELQALCNDLGMLACAKESYAIGSARDEVKQAAAHVADTMRNQGVIKVLKEQLLK